MWYLLTQHRSCGHKGYRNISLQPCQCVFFALFSFFLVCFCSHCHLRLAVGGQSLVFGVHVRWVAVAQRLWEELGERLNAELPLVGVGLAPAVWLVQWLVVVLLLDEVVLLLPPEAHVCGRRVLDVAFARVPHFEGWARSERVGVGFGDLGLWDLGGIDGDGQRCVDVGRREEWLVLGVKVDWLKSWRRLAVGIIYHRVALVVVSYTCVWIMGKMGNRYRNWLILFIPLH